MKCRLSLGLHGDVSTASHRVSEIWYETCVLHISADMQCEDNINERNWTMYSNDDMHDMYSNDDIKE